MITCQFFANLKHSCGPWILSSFPLNILLVKEIITHVKPVPRMCFMQGGGWRWGFGGYIPHFIVNDLSKNALCGRFAGFSISQFSFVTGYSLTPLKPKYTPSPPTPPHTHTYTHTHTNKRPCIDSKIWKKFFLGFTFDFSHHAETSHVKPNSHRSNK